jgi:hypothetical protein
MTMVEVLVASSVAAVLATGAAGLMSVGGQVTHRALDDLGGATALAQVVEWLPGQVVVSGDEPPTAPAPGWHLTRHHSTRHPTGMQVHYEWQRPDGATVVVSTWRHEP